MGHSERLWCRLIACTLGAPVSEPHDKRVQEASLLAHAMPELLRDPPSRHPPSTLDGMDDHGGHQFQLLHVGRAQKSGAGLVNRRWAGRHFRNPPSRRHHSLTTVQRRLEPTATACTTPRCPQCNRWSSPFRYSSPPEKLLTSRCGGIHIQMRATPTGLVSPNQSESSSSLTSPRNGNHCNIWRSEDTWNELTWHHL